MRALRSGVVLQLGRRVCHASVLPNGSAEHDKPEQICDIFWILFLSHLKDRVTGHRIDL